MKIFGLSDLHLNFSCPDKSMGVFGAHWVEHWRKIYDNWHALVSDDDVVLINGDLSWGLRPAEARQDLLWVSELPGHKILVRGNHDLWWQGISKIRQEYPKLNFIQNDALTIGGVCFCGTRGWNIPGSKDFVAQDQKIYERELERLRLTLKHIDPQANLRIFMCHFPPLLSDRRDTEVTALLEEAHIDLCTYGHLHEIHPGDDRFDIDHRGIQYRLLSCDYLDFRPKLLLER